MIKKFLFAIALLTFGFSNAQEQTVRQNNDLYLLGPAVKPMYAHINFPPAREVIKRTAVPDYKSLQGISLAVVSEYSDSQGNNWVELRRADGKNFFRHFRTVWANLDQALESGELQSKS